MVRIENECVDCGLPCLPSCPYRNVPHVYCDECNSEEEKYYRHGGEILCLDCLLKEMGIEELSFEDILQNYNY